MHEPAAKAPDDEFLADEQVDQQPEHLGEAVRLLHKMLPEHNGVVSSTALRRELENGGIANARELVQRLRFVNADASALSSFGVPIDFHHRGRSFYNEEGLRELQRETEKAAAKAELIEPPDASAQRRKVRGEEARLVTYVKAALEEIYWTDYGPEEGAYVFDVHNDRAGSDMENVDLLAVLWRSNRHVDLVSVEVKLEFGSRVVQQAQNYSRFSDRVWIAVPVGSECAEAATELRGTNPRLFDHVVDRGLGILACRRSQGRSYEVFPIHWPRRTVVDPVEREEFIGRHRPLFERAGVVPPAGAQGFPINY